MGLYVVEPPLRYPAALLRGSSLEIAAHNDITIVLEHYMDFPGEYFEKKLVRINGTVLTQDTYDDAYSDWCASGEEGDI